MSAPSNYSPRFPHSRGSRSRSQSPKPSPGGSRGGAAISLPPRHDPYPASPSRPSSRLGHGAAERDRNAMVTGPSRPSSRRNPVDHRNTPERFVSDRELDDFSGPPSQALRQSSIGPSNAVQMLGPHGFVSQRPTHLAFPSVQAQHFLSPQPAPYSLANCSQQSLNAELISLPRINFAPALPSRFPSRLGIPGKNVVAMTAMRLLTDRTPDNSSGEPSPAVAPSGFVPLSTIQPPDQHGSVAQQPTHPTFCSDHADYVQPQHHLAPWPAPLYPLANSSRPSFNPEHLGPPSSPYSPQLQQQSQGLFYQAHDFNVSGAFIEGNVIYNNVPSDQFMKELLKETIPGAEFDSSARDPPPRCHPGTRLDILARCLSFIHNCDGKRKTRWVVGAAGVGKSAIMQSVVESPELAVNSHTSVFFSVNGRDDGSKAVVTISYQFAAKCKPYRQLIEREISDDPSLLRLSMAKQFLKLIVEPFIHHPELSSPGRALVVIDGLDECHNPRTQLELLRLISDLCIKYPSSPLVWLIASRPEQHITSFFSRSEVMPAYEKEEILVDSDEARADVERYLRDKLKKIKETSDTVDPRWPEERDIWKLANAAGGLFAYAHTVIRYIDDVAVGSPASQFSVVMDVIDDHPMTDLQREEHPMALLDALYARILSKVTSKVMVNTRKLLLALASEWNTKSPRNFVELCNWLGMTPNDAYAAINYLRSVLRVPRRDEALKEKLEVFHKSFVDYISDFQRSRFSRNIKREARKLMAQCAFRILNEAPDGIDFGDANYGFWYGTLRRGPGTSDKISLTWPVDGSDDAMRLNMYKLAIGEVVIGMERGDPTLQSEFCIRILSTRFEKYKLYFPFDSLNNLVFDGSRRQEFVMHGVLKQMPLKAVGVSTLLDFRTKMQFRRSAKTARNLFDPWKPSCKHKLKGKWGEGDDQDWKTTFSQSTCTFCQERLERQLEYWKTRSPDHAVPTLFTSTGYCCVEFRFVDQDDGISEWTYRFWVELSLEERKKYGSDV